MGRALKADLVRVYDFCSAESGSSARLECRIDSSFFPDKLQYLITGFDGAIPTPKTVDWAAVALLYPAMLAGHDLIIEAPLSSRLLHAMRGDLQALLTAYDRRLKRIHVEAEAQDATIDQERPTRVGTGYSAGIDSFASYKLYCGDQVPASLRITDLTVHDVGAFGHLKDAKHGFDAACHRTAEFAARKGLGFFSVDSNLDEFFRVEGLSRTVFENSHSLRNASVAFALQSVLSVFLYSSAYPYDQLGLHSANRQRTLSTAYVDPILLALLSTEELLLISAGAGLSRAQKTALVADDPDAQALLDVCVASEAKREHAERANCSACYKCVRTMLTLEAFGKLDGFGARFNLEVFRRDRRAHLLAVQKRAACGNSVDKEILTLLKERGEVLPFSAKLVVRQFRETLPQLKSLLIR